MANVNEYTGWKCTHSASIISQNDTSATIRVICNWQNDGWTYDLGYVDAWVYCNGQEQKIYDSGSVNTTSSTNASKQLGYYDFVINKTTINQSIQCYAKIYNHSKYGDGTKSSSVTNVTVSAKLSYTISYNANGGNGAPANQTKWFGTNILISNIIPSWEGHDFLGWSTEVTGNVVYAPRCYL